MTLPIVSVGNNLLSFNPFHRPRKSTFLPFFQLRILLAANTSLISVAVNILSFSHLRIVHDDVHFGFFESTRSSLVSKMRNEKGMRCEQNDECLETKT